MGSIASSSPAQFLIIGAGSRGEAYARAVSASTTGIIAAVAEINPFKRQWFGKRHIWKDGTPQEGQSFSDWTDFITWETRRRNDPNTTSQVHITGIFICTLDETHADIIRALAPLNLHILCEKPLALNLDDCLSISKALASHPPRVFSIGHVLRYSPHNMTLRNLLVTDQIGEIISIQHTEPVGYWHFSHSYVRGNWRHQKHGVGSLLTKSCHDIDFILWLLSNNGTHHPSTISSHGALTHFRRAMKPAQAGSATNCLTCPAEPTCIYSARKIYLEKHKHNTGWPNKIVLPEIEDISRSQGWQAAAERLTQKLSEDYEVMSTDEAKRSWYGRCVYESDNDVVDDQSVTITWDDEGPGRGPKQALFHMTFPTVAQCERRGRIYGTKGEISYDSRVITVHSFSDGVTRVVEIPKQDPEVEKSHGGGDWGLAGAFVRAVQAVEGGMSVSEAQKSFVGCDLDEIIRSHAVVFAAEEARTQRKIVHWDEWCTVNGLQ